MLHCWNFGKRWRMLLAKAPLGGDTVDPDGDVLGWPPRAAAAVFVRGSPLVRGLSGGAHSFPHQQPGLVFFCLFFSRKRKKDEKESEEMWLPPPPTKSQPFYSSSPSAPSHSYAPLPPSLPPPPDGLPGCVAGARYKAESCAVPLTSERTDRCARQPPARTPGTPTCPRPWPRRSRYLD